MERFGKEYYSQTEEFLEKFRNTCMERFGCDNPSKNEDIKQKIKDVHFELFGFENAFQNEEIKEKIKQTLIKNYGVEHPMYSQEIKDKQRQTLINNGMIKSEYELQQIMEFRASVINETQKNIRNFKFKEGWDGFDYYDGEYIKDNFQYETTDERYPNIDHKISIKYGFDNNISIENIANISNLCITKRTHNISKGPKTEEEYKLYLENKKSTK